VDENIGHWRQLGSTFKHLTFNLFYLIGYDIDQKGKAALDQ